MIGRIAQCTNGAVKWRRQQTACRILSVKGAGFDIASLSGVRAEIPSFYSLLTIRYSLPVGRHLAASRNKPLRFLRRSHFPSAVSNLKNRAALLYKMSRFC
jgi:hypothetical protein